MEIRAAVLEAVRRKLSEDHLGEAPIKPGDSVTVIKKVAASMLWNRFADDICLGRYAASRVEPRFEQSVPRRQLDMLCGGFFYAQ